MEDIDRVLNEFVMNNSSSKLLKEVNKAAEKLQHSIDQMQSDIGGKRTHIVNLTEKIARMELMTEQMKKCYSIHDQVALRKALEIERIRSRNESFKNTQEATEAMKLNGNLKITQ